MHTPFKPLLCCCVLLAVTGHAAPAPAPAPVQTAPVVGWDLKGLTSDKVSSVMWTRREDHYTLQVVFAVPGGMRPPRSDPRPLTEQPYPEVNAWVLARDGGAIEPLRRLAVSQFATAEARFPARVVGRGQEDRNRRMEVNYVFPLAAADARGIVLKVDDRYFIDRPGR
jgi:hypothetical protein